MVSGLRFDDVHVRFGTRRNGTTAVDGVTLTVPSGQVVGLVGESGSGKSTLARATVGLAPLTSGGITFNGATLRGGTAPGASRFQRRPRPVHMVFQDPYSSLDPRLRIGASIAETMSHAAHRGASARRAEVERLLELVGLDADRADAYPADLSGGQRQRVAIARALAGNPQVIIADEITSALDVSIQGTVLNLIRELQRQLHFSMLFISHNLAVVRYVSDTIAVMYRGRIVEQGPTETLLNNPQDAYTRELLAAAPDAHRNRSLQPEADSTGAVTPAAS